MQVRSRASAAEAFEALDGEATLAMQGLVLVRVPTFAPILDPTWFVRRIEACEASLAAAKAGGAWPPPPLKQCSLGFGGCGSVAV